MRSTILGALLVSVVIVPALAQSAPNSSTSPAQPAPRATEQPAAATPATSTNMWRASKLIGLNVYNDQNEKLGDISEILLDKSGKVDGIVIGVGGFLGMGQHDIKVEMSKLKFVDEPVRTSSTSSTSTGTATGTGTTGAANRATTTTSSTSNDRKWYPDHAVLSGATKDQLKNMPQFKY